MASRGSYLTLRHIKYLMESGTTPPQDAAPAESIDTSYYASGLFDIEGSPAMKALDAMKGNSQISEEEYCKS